MENENKVESMEQVQNDSVALQGPISLPGEETVNSEPVIEIVAPSVETVPEINAQPIETPLVEPTPAVVEGPTLETIEPVEAVQTPIEAPVLDTPVVEPPVIEEPTPEVIEPAPVETPVVEPALETQVNPEPAVEPLETLAPPAENPTDSFQAQSVPEQPNPAPAPAPTVDPNLSAQQIAPALDEIAAENAPKKKSKAGLIIGILLVVLLIAAVVVYKFVFLKADKAYDQVFNVYKEKVSKALDATVAPIDNSILETGNISIETDVEELKDFNNLVIDYRFGLDYANKKVELTTNIKESDKEVLKSVIYLINNKVYLSSEEIYSKMLLIDDMSDIFDMNELFENVKTPDISYAVKGIGNHFINALDNADYSTKDTKIKIGNKSTMVTDNIMIINEKNLNKILKSFFKSVKEDNKLMEVLAEISEVDKTVIDSYIDEFLAADNTYDAFELKTHVYTKFFTTKMVGLKMSLTSEGTTMDLFDATFDKNDISVNVMNMYKLTAKSTDGKNYDVVLYQDDTEMFNCKITKNSENSYVFETTVDLYTFKVSYDYKEENSDQLINLIFEVNSDSEYMKVSLNSKTQYNMELGDVNVSSAVDVNKLSSMDQTKIERNIKKIINNSKALDSLLTMTGYKDVIENTSSNTSATTTKTTTEMCKDKDTVCSNCTGNTCKCVYHDMLLDAQTIYCPRNY